VSLDAAFAGPPRDRWGRPLLVPATGGKRVAYTRASTLATTLTDTYGLMAWKQRQVIIGLARRADLRALAASVDPGDKAALNEIAEQAMEAAESQAAANMGTALHALTERVDDGEPIEALGVSGEVAADLAAYRQATEGLQMLARETFVVCDSIRTAGSFDRLVRTDEGTFIADIKTGTHAAAYPHSASVQCAVYAHGTVYDTSTDQRTVDLSEHVDQDRALMIWLPQGQARCELVWLDISTGWEMAQHSVRVRAWRSSREIAWRS
jgi:hypothetical protein